MKCAVEMGSVIPSFIENGLGIETSIKGIHRQPADRIAHFHFF
jgi:hypothetical protein